MSRRIDVELTSQRDDGTWTWRAAGARQPKGDLDGSLLYPGAVVGDVVRADADFDVEGITITAVLPPKEARSEPDRLEIIGPPTRDDQLVTASLVEKRGRRDRGDRDRGDRERRPRGDKAPRRERTGERRDRPSGERAGGERQSGERAGGERRERRPRPERPAAEAKPKPKRLRAGRTHRNEVLASLPEEQKPIAEQVLRGGIPAVRQAIEKQNEQHRADGEPEIAAGPLVAMAEQVLPKLRTAEWHDRAEAALADIDDLDLRDLRSVVVAADVAARDETTRELAEQLRTALAGRVEAEQQAWLAELTSTLADGRVVRALRLSSRPPKAGTLLPSDLTGRLAEATAAALTPETTSDRFATVLDALAYSPVRTTVTAQGLPAEPSPELLAAIRKLASRLPQIAAQFGVEAAPAPARAPRGRGKRPSPAAIPPPPDVAPVPAVAPTAEPPAVVPPAEPPAVVTPAEPPAVVPPAEPPAVVPPAEAEAAPADAEA